MNQRVACCSMEATGLRLVRKQNRRNDINNCSADVEITAATESTLDAWSKVPSKTRSKWSTNTSRIARTAFREKAGFTFGWFLLAPFEYQKKACCWNSLIYSWTNLQISISNCEHRGRNNRLSIQLPKKKDTGEKLVRTQPKVDTSYVLQHLVGWLAIERQKYRGGEE